MPKDIQRDPLRRTVDHVDLLLVRRGEKIAVEVPLTLTGEAPTTTLVDQQQMTLSVEAEATSIPPGFEISVEGLDVGQSVTAGEVVLPAGVTLLADSELVLVQGLASPTAAEIEAAVEGEPAEAAAEGAGLAQALPRQPNPARVPAPARPAREPERGPTRARGADGRATSGAEAAAEGPWLVVGLGNPGPLYAGNRHNVGYLVADLLAGRMGGRFRSSRARADVLEGRLAGHRVVLAKPRSYMNESGGAVAGVRSFFKVGLDRLVAVHDELDIPFGAIRLKRGGGEGGHNGLRSLSRSLGSRDYLRVRIGVGRPPGRQDPADYVLEDFNRRERTELPLIVDRAADAVEALLALGLEAAQNRFHADPGH